MKSLYRRKKKTTIVNLRGRERYIWWERDYQHHFNVNSHESKASVLFI